MLDKNRLIMRKRMVNDEATIEMIILMIRSSAIEILETMRLMLEDTIMEHISLYHDPLWAGYDSAQPW